MRNDITISKEIIEISLEAQIGIRTDKTYKDLEGKMVTMDKDILMVYVCSELGYDLDWEESIVVTNKGYYNKEEFMIKFMSNGRKALKGIGYETL